MHQSRKIAGWRRSPAHAVANGEALLARNRELEEQVALLREERNRHRRSINEAAQVQRKLSAPRQLRRNGLQVAGEVFPVEQVCGDFVTCFEAHGKIVFAIGDILGKGLHAGMWFTHLVGLVRVFACSLQQPAAVAAAINAHLSGLQPEPPITSLFLGELDPATSELTFCNAGHPTPVLVRSDGTANVLAAGGPLLGAVAGVSYLTGSAKLAPGDTLVGYSDGLVECRNPRGEDFGVERLVSAVRNTAAASANEILFSVLGAAQDFAASQPCADDLALMVVHRVHEHAS
jgi:sigma-B regulation protein RsbU (phosphoserine phosphatase)